LENKSGIRAVGVLGSDLYDKLLVLQALRPLLPDARFFTTDLDALLLHPAEQKVTRNLLVASGFGLQLHPDIQRSIPPFRSNYQTAEFLAARIAVSSDDPPNRCWTHSPLLFEIGSSRAFQFAETSSHEPSECEAILRDCKEDPSTNQQTKCRRIQPVAMAMLPRLSSEAFTGLAVIALLIGSGLAVIPLAMRRFGKSISESHAEPELEFSRSTGVLVVIGILVILGTSLVWFASPGEWLTPDDEPILLFEGISVCPTILLRLATLALCIWLLLYSLDKLDANMRQIECDLHLEQTTRDAKKGWAALPLGMKLAYGLGYASPNAKRDDVSHFWRKYYYRGRPWPRVGRVALGVLAVGLLYLLLTHIFGTPSAPTRGPLSKSLYPFATLSLFLHSRTDFLRRGRDVAMSPADARYSPCHRVLAGANTQRIQAAVRSFARGPGRLSRSPVSRPAQQMHHRAAVWPLPDHRLDRRVPGWVTSPVRPQHPSILRRRNRPFCRHRLRGRLAHVG
jgi:hypothetical protein